MASTSSAVVSGEPDGSAVVWARACTRALVTWLSAPGQAHRLALVVFVLTLPALWSPLACDDFGIAARLASGPLSAYAFTPRDHEAARALIAEERLSGIAPWWVGDELRARFFRPVASLSLWLDLGHGAPTWLVHLGSCVLYGLTIALAVALYRRLGLTDSALVWSIVFLGLDGAYAASVGWIAARNTLLAAAFGLASLLALVRARREQRSGFLAASYFAFVAPLERVAFRFWTGTVVAPWTPPSIGATTTVPASSIF